MFCLIVMVIYYEQCGENRHVINLQCAQGKMNRRQIEIETAHDKTYNKSSKDSNQPVQPPSAARALVYRSLDCLGDVEGTCDRRRL